MEQAADSALNFSQTDVGQDRQVAIVWLSKAVNKQRPRTDQVLTLVITMPTQSKSQGTKDRSVMSS